MAMNRKRKIKILELGSHLALVGSTILLMSGLILFWPDPVIGSNIVLGADQGTLVGVIDRVDRWIGSDPVDAGDVLISFYPVLGVDLVIGWNPGIGADRVVGALCCCIGVVLAGFGTMGLDRAVDWRESVQWGV